ncbi:MAG TPA: TIM barrel protein [bacterium]|nr:TIM barrel protein [bacterium]
MSQGDGGIHFGLVTYLWGKDWDVPALIRNCERAGAEGVELRTQHAHGVDVGMSERAKQEVRLRFQSSPVTLVGLGTNWEFHSPDPEELQHNIEMAKQYLHLSYEVGGSGVKVKPNTLPDGVPVERTIEQIGRSLNELGKYGANLGQEVRLEAHGRETQQPEILDQILEVADHPNVGLCWNSNTVDVEGKGFEYNFNLVKDRLSHTIHTRRLDSPDYPYQRMFKILVDIGYEGWILIEESSRPQDRVEALAQQAQIFQDLLVKAKT